MTKPKARQQTTTRSITRKTDKPATRTRRAAESSKPKTGSDTKRARIIAMLRTPAGATIAWIMNTTDWQQHSVRGFLAGVVRKKLGLNLVSVQTDEGRVYRIKEGKAAHLSTGRPKQTV